MQKGLSFVVIEILVHSAFISRNTPVHNTHSLAKPEDLLTIGKQQSKSGELRSYLEDSTLNYSLDITIPE